MYIYIIAQMFLNRLIFVLEEMTCFVLGFCKCVIGNYDIINYYN